LGTRSSFASAGEGGIGVGRPSCKVLRAIMRLPANPLGRLQKFAAFPNRLVAMSKGREPAARLSLLIQIRVVRENKATAMPIIAAVASILLFWVAYWFIRMGGLDHLRAKSAQKKEETRFVKARASEQTAPLKAVDDPRDAAIILMLLMARVNGDPTREQIARIEKIAATTFGFENELPGRMAQARFIGGRAERFEQAVGLFSDMLMQRLTPEERNQLIGMVEEIARADGSSLGQIEAIAALNRRVGLVRVH
jgi:uncharacterized tellurite resistance protein B-like protein